MIFIWLSFCISVRAILASSHCKLLRCPTWRRVKSIVNVVRNGCDVRDQRRKGATCNRYRRFGAIRRIVMGAIAQDKKHVSSRLRVERRQIQYVVFFLDDTGYRRKRGLTVVAQPPGQELRSSKCLLAWKSMRCALVD